MPVFTRICIQMFVFVSISGLVVESVYMYARIDLFSYLYTDTYTHIPANILYVYVNQYSCSIHTAYMLYVYVYIYWYTYVSILYVYREKRI